MSVEISAADSYILANCIESEDYSGLTPERKQAFLTVAERELRTRFPAYVIPDNAVYEFTAVLAVVFNDTNKLQQQGVTSFSLSGVASFNFLQGGVRPPGSFLYRYIPQEAVRLIGEENGVTLSARRSGRSVL